MDLRSIGMGLAFAFMWSSAFASARIIVAQAPPLSALSLRFLVSGLVALAIGAALGQSARLSRAQWRGVVVFGLCQNALYLGLNFIAMRWVSASFAAIVASTMPLLVALAGWIFLRERLRPLTALGLLAGIAGVALIMGTRLSGGEDALGFLLCAVGVLALTVATLTVRVASSGGNLLMIVGLQMLVGSAALAPVALATETPLSVDWSLSLVLAFAYTTLVPGLLATWVWFLLVGRIGAVRAATFHFLNPFFGVAVAAVLLGERMGIWDAVGVVVIASGILAVQLSRVPEAARR
ncbi:DMT family transporter [Rhodobacter sp. NSM]|uniref:DMT family transporter n=1 Tax=Rhodobacter sp. NSM TaxID=3457501 RepID=UPI003FD6289D